MTRTVQRFTLIMTAALIIAAVLIEASNGGDLAALVSAGLAAGCLGLAMHYVSRGVMSLVEPSEDPDAAQGRLELLRADLTQVRAALDAVRLDARIQNIAGSDEQAELEAPLIARVEALEARIGRLEEEGDEDPRDEEILEIARARIPGAPKATKGGEA